MPNFEFVNVGSPGDLKKHSTRIRRHVMKDIGKARRRPKARHETRVDEQVAATSIDDEILPSAEKSSKSRGSSQVLSLSDPLSDGSLSTMVYPTDMDEERLQLARLMFAEAKSNYRPFRSSWLSMGLSDPAAWHITMANAVLFRKVTLRGRKPGFDADAEAMKWYEQSLETITRRLADSEQNGGEGLVIAVVGLLCHDTSMGNFERQEIHLRGLKRLVDQKGGIDELRSTVLRLMISWQDLSGATYRNAAPHFKIPKGSIDEIDTGDDTSFLEVMLMDWDMSCPALGDIVGALKATAAVASFIRTNSRSDPKFWTDDVTAARLLGPAFHKILSLKGRPLPEDMSDAAYSATAAREAFRRAALIFLAMVKIKFGAYAPEMSRHIYAFHQISLIPMVDWAFVPQLNLWAHFIAALQEETQDRAWHVFTIASIMESLHLSTSTEALDVARGIIWVEELVKGQCASLCRQIDDFVKANARWRSGDIPLDIQLYQSPAETVP
ncbi:hypothetical protein F5Y15DRAFT_191342 [Xylariaceae sp. FL0016]|nr:hypothetical protein F5Y15DRAFT_191342 [Xylariaceae sp. FL0016]